MLSFTKGLPLLALLFFAFLPQISNAQCNITFTGYESNGTVPFQVEAHFYMINETCGGNPSGAFIAMWASRELGTNRWIGVGSSLTGTMCNSDMFTGYYALNDSSQAILLDRHAMMYQTPDPDDDQSDIEVKELVMEDGKLVLRFMRPFKPDLAFASQDANFENPQVMMVATGYLLEVENVNGPGEMYYHAHNRRNGTMPIDFATECRGCPCIETPSNGTVEFSNILKYVPGTVATFYCDGGHELVGESSITCQSNGEWSGMPPTCEFLFTVGNCGATGYRELGDEESRYDTRFGFSTDLNKIFFELVLHTDEPYWVGMGLSAENNGMCGADIVTAYLARNDSSVQIEDRIGENSGRPRLDNFTDNLHDKQLIRTDGKLRFFFSRPLGGPFDADDLDNYVADAEYALAASGYLAEDNENPMGTISYHFSSRWMFPIDTSECAACVPSFPVNGHIVDDEGVPIYFLDDQITVGCNRFYELHGPSTWTCTQTLDPGLALPKWNGESDAMCLPLGKWRNCSMEGRNNLTTDIDPVLWARWMYSPTTKLLTVEIKRRVQNGENRWVGFGVSENGTMCWADMTTAFFSLQNGTLQIEDRVSTMYGRPEVDADQSQIKSDRNYGEIIDGVMVVRFTRYLKTKDNQDMQDLESGKGVRLMFATGYVASYSNTHGRILYHRESSWASPMDYNLTSLHCEGCEPFDEIYNMTHSQEYTDEMLYNGVTVTHGCNDTHVLVGSKNNTCESGDWGAIDSICRLPCPTPSAPEDGSVQFSTDRSSLVYEDEAYFSCDVGFDLCGKENLTCLMNGKWNYDYPLCRLFCPIQNVTFGPDYLREIHLYYREANSFLFLVKDPTALDIGRLSGNGWKEIKFNISDVKIGFEQIVSRKGQASTEGRISSSDLSLPTPGRRIEDNDRVFIYSRSDSADIDLKVLFNTLAYTHGSPDGFPTRVITVTVTDIYGQESPPLIIHIQHVGINDDAPVVSDNVTHLSFTEGQGPISLFRMTLRVEDPDHPIYKLRSATCQITASPSTSYDSNNEILAAKNCSNFTVAFDAGAGTLTIHGPGSEEEFEYCLNNVTYYHDGEVFPSNYRDITCEVSDGDRTGSAHVQVTLININDAPEALFSGNSISLNVTYTEYGPTVYPFETIVLSDPDHLVLTNVSIAVRMLTFMGDSPDEIVLPTATPTGLTVSVTPNWPASDKFYVIFGSASISSYQEYIRGIGFRSTGQRPFRILTSDRMMTIELNDGELASISATATIKIVDVNDNPILQFDPTADPEALPSDSAQKHVTVFKEDGPPVAVAPNTTTLRDVDSDEIAEINCELQSIRDGMYENLTLNYGLARMYGLTAHVFHDNGKIVARFTGLARPQEYLAVFLSLTYHHRKDELTTGNRFLTCYVIDDGNAQSAAVYITIAVEATNDEIDIDLGVAEEIVYREGQQSGVYVIPAPHRIVGQDAEGDKIKRISFQLMTVPAGFLDPNEFLFLIKDVPNEFVLTVDDSMRTLTFEGVANLSALVDLARRVMYLNAEDEPTLFVNDTFTRVRRYVVVRVCDTGTPPAVTEFKIRVNIETINEHAPVVMYSIHDDDDVCIAESPNSPVRRRSVEKKDFKTIAARQLSVRSLSASASHISQGQHVNVTFSGETNQPRVLGKNDLAKILTLYPNEMDRTPHFGLWESDNTLTILYTGTMDPIPAAQVKVSFKSPGGACNPEIDCLNGICSSVETSCPVTGSYVMPGFVEQSAVLEPGSKKISDGSKDLDESAQGILQQTSLYKWEVGAVAMIVMCTVVAIAVIVLCRKK